MRGKRLIHKEQHIYGAWVWRKKDNHSVFILQQGITVLSLYFFIVYNEKAWLMSVIFQVVLYFIIHVYILRNTNHSAYKNEF